MHYPHEREERQQLLTALVDDAQGNFINLVTSIFVTGFFVCLLSLLSSFVFHSSTDTSKLAWFFYWNTGMLLCSILIFLLPKLQPRRTNRKLIGLKRGFVIHKIIPSLLTSLLLGNIALFQAAEHFLLAPIIWSCGYALSLLSLSTFHLTAIKNLAICILILSLSAAIIALRHYDPAFVPHQIANLTLLVCVGLPCLLFSLFKILLKK